jgi:AcrR family transcriptional regulator
VFASKGVALATMDDIAHEAELSKGTLYLYFDSKDELFLEIAVRAVREVLDRILAAQSDGGTGFTRLARSLRAYARFGLEQPDRFQVAVGWMISGSGGTLQSERFAEYKRLVADFYGRSPPRSTPARSTAPSGRSSTRPRSSRSSGARCWGCSSCSSTRRRSPRGCRPRCR